MILVFFSSFLCSFLICITTGLSLTSLNTSLFELYCTVLFLFSLLSSLFPSSSPPLPLSPLVSRHISDFFHLWTCLLRRFHHELRGTRARSRSANYSFFLFFSVAFSISVHVSVHISVCISSQLYLCLFLCLSPSCLRVSFNLSSPLSVDLISLLGVYTADIQYFKDHQPAVAFSVTHLILVPIAVSSSLSCIVHHTPVITVAVVLSKSLSRMHISHTHTHASASEAYRERHVYRETHRLTSIHLLPYLIFTSPSLLHVCATGGHLDWSGEDHGLLALRGGRAWRLAGGAALRPAGVRVWRETLAS